MTIERRIADLFAAAATTGQLHVHRIGHGDNDGCGRGVTVAIDADRRAPLASVAKIVVVTAFARACAAGTLDPTERVDVPHDLRLGGLAIGGCRDDVTMSLRDLAWMMMCVSDNPSFDVLFDRVGQRAIDELVADVGLTDTTVTRSMSSAYRAAATELGHPDAADADTVIAAAGASAAGLALVDPSTTNASTPSDIGRLLEAVWTDRAGPPEACAFVRSAMAVQATNHRLATGFADDVSVSAKTGTFPFVRNDAGVVEYPDGDRFAAVVFTRAASWHPRQPAIDAAIGAAARAAVDHLRTHPAGRA